GSSLSRDATIAPADPAPTTMMSYFMTRPPLKLVSVPVCQFGGMVYAVWVGVKETSSLIVF
ncbi:MAG: hypothetical protein OXD31_04355, partial [Chloroflexi bacterium]|nr:hypothetical protein [Chloroflexota bacterium]